MGNIIKITESDLKTLIRESVEQYLNEVDLDTAIRASVKAGELGRAKQASTFKKYALDKVNDGLSTNNSEIVDISDTHISYKNFQNSVIRIQSNGVFVINNAEYDMSKIARVGSAPPALKVKNKLSARKIAEWVERYLSPSYSFKNTIADWHWWAIL